MEFLWRPEREPRSVAVFPGAWNPPTIAHLEIARAAAQNVVDQVAWVLPRGFPHKGWEGASFEERCAMLSALAGTDESFAAAISDGGLYIDIARETKQAYGGSVEIGIVCGRDAAERIERWDYGQSGVFEQMIQEFRLFVAARAGDYVTDFEHGGRICSLEMPVSFDDVSSSEVRRRIAAGEDWESLVPEAIRSHMRRIYSSIA